MREDGFLRYAGLQYRYAVPRTNHVRGIFAQEMAARSFVKIQMYLRMQNAFKNAFAFLVSVQPQLGGENEK